MQAGGSAGSQASGSEKFNGSSKPDHAQTCCGLTSTLDVLENSMGIEIERKFLVIGTAWRQGGGVRFSQGYLNRDKTRTVRVRLAGEQAFLTIKGVSVGASRAEFEYEIPAADAEQLLMLSDGPIIEKIRRVIEFDGASWEVDEFL
jgi:CYTH domain-containing protein